MDSYLDLPVFSTARINRALAIQAKIELVRSCPIATQMVHRRERCHVPCVDGSELARAFFTFAALVGAAMCSAFKCGTQGRWP